MLPLALALLSGCFKPYEDLPPLDFSEVGYENPLLESEDAVVKAFDTGLTCPDGEPARAFAVYRAGLEGPAPVAVVLHSGAFDYIVEPDPSGYLNGRAYRAESRLSRQWSIAKVWETLGMGFTEVDPAEENLGALPAALTDAGVVQLYPANCWGDLWHNEQGYQDSATDIEGFDRNGRTFAYWMIRFVVEQDFAAQQGFSVPVRVDPTQVFLVGLGEGGRGVAELLTHDNMPAIQGVLVDSSPDLLSPYLADPLAWPDYVTGLERIFPGEDLAMVDDWSLHALAQADALPERVAVLWSDLDPQLPAATLAPTAAAVQAALPGAFVYNAEAPTHVQVNSDPVLAAEAVDYLLTGNIPVFE